MSQPYFSIGVTTFNRLELLVETLSSILAQTFPDFEILVGNDNTARTLTKEMLGLDDPRIRILNHPVNLGEIGNMNELLAQARGRYFTWLADDDLFAPNFLQAVHNAHHRFDPVPCVFSSYRSGESAVVSAPTLVEDQTECLSGGEFVGRYLRRELLAIGCYAVFDIARLRAFGGMERLGQGFSPYSDNLLVIRSGSFDCVCYINAPLLFFRTHPGSVSYSSTDVNAYITAQEDLCRLSVDVFRLPGLSGDFQRNLYELLSHWCMTFTFHALMRDGGDARGMLWKYLGVLIRHSRELTAAWRAKLALDGLRLLLLHWLLAARRGLRKILPVRRALQ